MKVIPCLFALVAALLAAGPARAEIKPADPAAAVLHVTVVEPVNGRSGDAFTDFDRLDIALERIAKQRRWPAKVATERLVGNTPDYDPELRVVLQPVRLELGEYVFRGWITLTRDGQKHDFGIVKFGYLPRMNEHFDDAMEKVFLGAAGAIAGKVEPLLFPELKAKK